MPDQPRHPHRPDEASGQQVNYDNPVDRIITHVGEWRNDLPVTTAIALDAAARLREVRDG